MSYDTKIDLSTDGGLELDGGYGPDFQAALDALRACIPDPGRWYDLGWYRQLLLGEVQLCSDYELVVEPSLAKLSLRFPGAVLFVRGLGEDVDDMWLRKYEAGRAEIRELTQDWRELRSWG